MPSSTSETVQTHIRSFVLRAGRITSNQTRGLLHGQEHWCVSLEQLPQLLQEAPKPVILDIGFGRGESALQLADHKPNHWVIGIEVYRAGVGHLLSELLSSPRPNIRIAMHDAIEVLKALPLGCAEHIQLLFPDPWPKKRHHKRRLVNFGNLPLLLSRLQAQGTLLIRTDHTDYAQWIDQCLTPEPSLERQPVSTHHLADIATHFSQKAVAKGALIHDFLYLKK